MKMYRKVIKRLLDIIISGLGLLILSPVLLIVALMIRKKLGSPILYKQKRPGYQEKIFEIYKFRTMSEERDEKGELLPDEQRLSGFGKKLRALSLDELPQLWNILKGDMSVIGPRPLLVSYLELYTPSQHRRHEVRPGLFSLASVNGRNNQSWESKFEFDLYYVEHLSFLLDCRIFLKCVGVVIKRENVNLEGEATTVAFTGGNDDTNC